MTAAQPATHQEQADGVGAEPQQAEADGEVGQRRLSPGQQAAKQPADLQSQQQQQLEMPPEYADGFAQVLAVLNGSRVRPFYLWSCQCEPPLGGGGEGCLRGEGEDVS